jgi:hypothetical protein
MLPVFVVLLAAAILFDKALLGDRQLASPHLVLSLAALWALLRPASLGRFATLLAVYLATWFADLPTVSNHVMLTALVLAVFSAWFFPALLRAPRPDGSVVYARLAPLMRCCALLMYGFAGFAKLNRGFLDRELSCGVAMYGRLSALAHLPRAPWALDAAIWGTIVAELTLPLLLFFRATRLWGLLFGIGFHTALAVPGHVPFSSYGLMILSTFLPEGLGECLRRSREERPWVGRWASRIGRVTGSPWAFPLAALAWLLTIPASTSGWIPRYVREFDEALLLPFGAYLAALLALLGWALARLPRPIVSGRLGPARPDLVLGAALIILNGLQPYLGLKTTGSFTMYSNLQTEGTRWNHLVVPRAFKRFTVQNDLVRVIDASSARLKDTAREGSSWVFFQFHRYASRHPEVSVSYERSGRRVDVPRAGDDPLLGRGPNPLLGKLLGFRDVDPPGHATCRR